MTAGLKVAVFNVKVACANSLRPESIEQSHCGTRGNAHCKWGWGGERKEGGREGRRGRRGEGRGVGGGDRRRHKDC